LQQDNPYIDIVGP